MPGYNTCLVLALALCVAILAPQADAYGCLGGFKAASSASGQCKWDSTRTSSSDQSCTATVTQGTPGYCECTNGVKATFNCDDTYGDQSCETACKNIDFPGSPYYLIATPGHTQVSVAFTLPSFNGGRPITSYTVYATDGTDTYSFTGTSSPIVATGLTNGVQYSFSAKSTSTVGDSPISDPVLATPVNKCNAGTLNNHNAPTLDSSSNFQGDVFTMVINMPNNFKNTNFTFQNSKSGCQGNSGWTQIATDDTGCSVTMKRAISWANMYSSCGWKRQEVTSFVIFTLQLKLDANQEVIAQEAAEDQVMSFVRPVSNVVTFKIQFPKFIDVVSNTTSVQNILLGDKVPGQAVLSNLKVNSQTTTNSSVIASMDMEILTIVTYPDFVKGATTVSSPTGTSAVITSNAVSSSCNDAAGASCVQQFNVHVDLTADICTFTGAYTFKFPFTCRDSYSGSCPQAFIQVTIDVKTLNHCPAITDVTLMADMYTFADASYTVANAKYKMRDIVYGQIRTRSDTASIYQTKFVKLVLQQPGYADTVMFNNYALTDAGNTAKCKITNSAAIASNNATIARFSCKIQPSQVILPATASRTVTWYGLAEVEYVNTYAQDSETGKLVVSRRLLAFHMEPEKVMSSGSAEAATAVLIENDDQYDATTTSEVVYTTASSANQLMSTSSLLIALFVTILAFFKF